MLHFPVSRVLWTPALCDELVDPFPALDMCPDRADGPWLGALNERSDHRRMLRAHRLDPT